VSVRAVELVAASIFLLLAAGCSQTTGTASAPASTVATTVVPAPGQAATAATAAPAITLDAGAARARKDAEYRALEFGKTGIPVSWRSGKSSGEVVPGAPYQVNSYSCRDYSYTLNAGGTTQSARASACRQANGSWQTVS